MVDGIVSRFYRVLYVFFISNWHVGSKLLIDIQADYGCVNANTRIPDHYSMWYLTLNKGRFPSYFKITTHSPVICRSLLKTVLYSANTSPIINHLPYLSSPWLNSSLKVVCLACLLMRFEDYLLFLNWSLNELFN